MKPLAIVLCFAGSLGAAAAGVHYAPLAYGVCTFMAIVGLVVVARAA